MQNGCFHRIGVLLVGVCDVCGIRNNGLQLVINAHSASLACQDVFRVAFFVHTYWLNINNYEQIFLH